MDDTEIRRHTNGILEKLCHMCETHNQDQKVLVQKLETILTQLETIKPPKSAPGLNFKSGDMEDHIYHKIGDVLDEPGFNEDELEQLPNKIYVILRKVFNDESCRFQPITIWKPTEVEYYLSDDEHKTIMFEYVFELHMKYRIVIHAYMGVHELDPVYQTEYYNVWLTKYKDAEE